MLKIVIPDKELFDEVTETFIYTEEKIIQLEHSLVSISKWESIVEKPFISKTPKSIEETMLYIGCMTITKKVDEKTYASLSDKDINTINAYIDKKCTATIITKLNKGSVSNEIVTSELIYYWMLCHKIPFECERWHLNRLLTLIDICNAKNAPPQKMSRAALAQTYKDLNEQRRAQLNSKG